MYISLFHAILFFFFFFKQKTAYEMRISDWSSDVCSSDLVGQLDPPRGRRRAEARDAAGRLPGRAARQPPVRTQRDRAGRERVPDHRRAGRLGARAETIGTWLGVQPARWPRARAGHGRGLACGAGHGEIGRASCRERVWPSVEVTVAARSLQKKNKIKILL